MATAGNLNIIGDIKEQKPKEPKKLEEKISGDEAKILDHFFRQELTELGDIGCVKREPKHGSITSLIVEYPDDKAEIVRKYLENLRKKLYELPVKDTISVPKDKNIILRDFVHENENNKDLLVLPDIAQKEVKIVGKTQEILNTAVHQFKVKTGEIKLTGRMTRQNSESSEGKTYSSVVTGKNTKLYPDLGSMKADNMSGSTKYSTSKNNFSSSTSTSWSNSANSSSGDFRFETKLNGGMLLKVYKASITRVDVDAIVNAANDTMMHGGGVARVISEAAGYDLDKESREHVHKNGQLKVSENIVTTAGRLSYKGVIHAVGPIWHDYSRGDKLRCLDDLFECVWNILETCKKERYRTVAMSAISAGIFAVPKELCADMYLYAAYKYSKTRLSTDCPEELHIIDVDTTILQLVEQSVKRWKKDPESINQRITLPKYLKENPHQAGYPSYSGGGQRSHGRHRTDGHHRGGDENKQYRKNDGDGIHGNESRHRNTSPHNKDMEATNVITTSITKQQDEKFKWGGVAKKFTIGEQVTVMIYKGEITKVRQMDAIVCGTGVDLEPRGFISNALQKAGGYEYTTNYKKMKDRHKMCNPSDVFKCKAGDLGANFVLHVASNRLVEADVKEMKAYKECMVSVLKKARRNDLEKLAIPLFGTGTLQTNQRKLKLCGAACLKALDEFLAKYGDKHYIKEIHLVNNSNEVNDALVEVFDDAVGKTTKPETNSGEYKESDRHSSFRRSYSASGQGELRGHSSHGSSASGYNGEEFGGRQAGRSINKNRSGGNAGEEDMEVEEEGDDHYDTIFNVSVSNQRNTTSDQVDPPVQAQGDKPGNLTIFDEKL